MTTIRIVNTTKQSHSLPGNVHRTLVPGPNQMPAAEWESIKEAKMIQAHIAAGNFVEEKLSAAEKRALEKAEKDAEKLKDEQEKAAAKRLEHEKKEHEKQVAKEHDDRIAAQKPADKAEKEKGHAPETEKKSS